MQGVVRGHMQNDNEREARGDEGAFGAKESGVTERVASQE